LSLGQSAARRPSARPLSVSALALCGLFNAPVAAQAKPLVVSVTVARSWVGTIYRGPLVVVVVSGATYRQGAVGLDGFTLIGGRIQVRPETWPLGVYASAGFGTATVHANGRDATGSARYQTEADAFWLALGAFRSVAVKPSLPAVELGAGVTAFRLQLPTLSQFTFQGPLVRDYLSPGIEVTVGLRYPARPSRLQVELRSTFAVVYHDTENLDGNVATGPLTGPNHRWGPTATLGAGIRVAL
jgi:hypothetical protein